MSMFDFAYNIDAATGERTPAANTYEAVRTRFETRCFVVQFPIGFAILKKDLHTVEQMLGYGAVTGMFAPLRFWEAQADGTWLPHPFIKKWLSDARRRTVRCIVHNPARTPPNAFNTWRPAAASLLPANAAAVPEPITRYVRSAYAGEGEADFILDFLCNTIQRPGTHPGVALLLANEPRGGTTEQLLDFVRLRVLGGYQTLKTADVKQELLGRFQTVTERCVLVHITDNFHANAEGIRGVVAVSDVTIQDPRNDARQVRNISHIVCTSSHSTNAYRAVENMGRQRFALIVNGGGGGELPEGYLDRDIVARGFYDFAMGRDLSRYLTRDFRGFRLPEVTFTVNPTAAATTATTTPQRLAPFLSAVVNGRQADPDANNIMTMHAAALFDLFGAFHGEAQQGTMTRFGRELRGYSTCMRKQRTSGGIVYRIDTARLRRQLTDAGLFDAQASLTLLH